jgi:formamidopyrimidine-DNA glycosylase
MPESPEVDALAGAPCERLLGARIADIDLDEFGAFTTRSRALAELRDRTVTGIRRFGKHLAIDTDGPSLVVGFGRSGWLRWDVDAEAEVESASDAEAKPAPVIARISFEGGDAVLLTDAGGWLSVSLSIADDPADLRAIAKLGADPAAADFTATDLDRVLIGRRKQLKALLQEQESLSGIGNAYSDEILHVARLWPLLHASDLDEAQRAALFEAVRAVLGDAFAARRGIPIDQLKAAKVAAMRVHGRTGEACPVCGGTVADVPGSKGAAQYCPICQPAP